MNELMQKRIILLVDKGNTRIVLNFQGYSNKIEALLWDSAYVTKREILWVVKVWQPTKNWNVWRDNSTNIRKQRIIISKANVNF